MQLRDALRTAGSDAPGDGTMRAWFLRPAGPVAVALLAAVLIARAVRVAVAFAGGGMDNAFVVHAGQVWLHGGAPYADRRFLYLPSAVLFAGGQAALPPEAVRVGAPVVCVALLVAGWWCAVRLFRVPPGSRFAVLGLLGLVLLWAPVGHLVNLGNWTAVSALALPAALLLADRGRWAAAGAVLGVSVAVKPLLLPVALLFVLARRWRGLAWMVALPAVLSLGAALVMPDPGRFFTHTLPFLLQGGDGLMRPFDASLPAVLPRLGIPPAVAEAVALAAAAGGVVCACLRWRRADPGPARLADTAALLMLASYLVARPSYDHYLVVVVPLLCAGALEAGSVARSPWFWAALVPQVPEFTFPYLDASTRRAFKDALTLCGLTLVLAAACARPGTRTAGGRAASHDGRAAAAAEAEAVTAHAAGEGVAARRRRAQS
ncbi:glycosyltransferase family 87 protein [Streptomyces tropicalis]|uniref:Glycosyltransferase family 87 protein n=1 Tax=Streptomyces tropicalis TaxID=3034234 RepID=A0ABT6ADV4_9ACTN|nr:glycosyltransferase family 87 protein [Streptomyces tropicalis]MDF3302628.1 glycosyltransferase family 87 protein [Streptomyces tropicalis]